MSDAFIPVCEPTLTGKEKEYVLDCLETNWISSMGKYIELLEKGFAEHCGTKHAVAVNNGTSALHLALAALNISQGDEVIVPSFTMIASINAILYTGARPVIVDSELTTWNMDLTPEGIQKIKAKITPNTKAIMPVHIYGHPVNMEPLITLAKEHNIKIIEDAAEAHGATYTFSDGTQKKCGNMSEVACFSFYANKLMTTGEGGIVVTNDDETAERLKLLRNHSFIKPRFLHHEIGYNFRMTNLQAAVGYAQLQSLDKFVDMRRANAQLYNKLLKESGLTEKGITLPPELPWAKNVYWMYGILVNKELFGMDKDELMKALGEKGIQTRSFFYPMHQQPMFKEQKYPNGLSERDLNESYPVADQLAKQGLYLPSSSHLTPEQIKRVVDALSSLAKQE